MAKYNLLNNSLIESLTSSGTGDVLLTNEDKYALYDSNTTSSGISLTNTDILYLDINLYNRITVDDFSMYINTTIDRNSALIKVDFYYKNNEGDDYILCSKEQNSDEFYPINLPVIFAPQFIRIIIDSLECDIFELKLFNDDNNISFGSDGTKSLFNIGHAQGDYSTLEIFNNAEIGTDPVNAYLIIDYQAKESDSYVKLANSPNGPFKSINDSYIFNNSDTSLDYYWAQGKFENTLVYENSVQLTHERAIGDIGYYTTPVFSLGDKFESSYLITRQTSTTDKDGNNYDVSWSNDSNIKTVKVRSSNTAPLPFNRFFHFYTDSVSRFCMYEGDLSNGAEYNKLMSNLTGIPKEVIFDYNRSELIILISTNYFYKFPYFETGGLTYSAYLSTTLDMSGKWGVDRFGNIYGEDRTSGNYKLKLISNDFGTITTLIDNGGISLVTDLSVNINQETCWFSSNSSKIICHINNLGDFIASISLNDPGKICALNDGGCLVSDTDTHSIIRYNYYGEKLNEIKYESIYIINDIQCANTVNSFVLSNESFWVFTEQGNLFKYNIITGDLEADVIFIGADRISVFKDGCLVMNDAANIIYQLNNNAEIVHTFDISSLYTLGENIFSLYLDYDSYLNLRESVAILPLPLDPVWGDNGDDWVEVNDDGFILPMTQFHQLKYKFNGNILDVPIINPGAETGDTSGWEDWDSANLKVTVDGNYEGTYGFCSLTNYVDTYMYQMLDLTTVSGIDLDIIDNCNTIYDDGYIFSLSAYYRKRGSSAELKFKFYNESLVPIDPDVWEETGYLLNTYWKKIALHKKVLSGTRYVLILFKIYRPTIESGDIDAFKAQLVRSASLDYINIPTPTKINDIAPQTYKNLYLKSEYPPSAENTEYESKLKCWWSN